MHRFTAAFRAFMETRRHIDEEKGIVYITVTGPMTLAEIKEDLAQLAALTSRRPEMPRLIDLRGATTLLSADEIAQLADIVKSNPHVISRTRRALLVGSDLAFGMYRMFESFAAGGAVDYRVCRDEGEAHAWVEEAAAAARRTTPV
jgi:hypothetical protein